MKKIRYSIENKTVWKDLFDTKLGCVMNFKGIYTGTSKKDCEKWLKKHKRGLRNAGVNK